MMRLKTLAMGLRKAHVAEFLSPYSLESHIQGSVATYTNNIGDQKDKLVPGMMMGLRENTIYLCEIIFTHE